MTAYMLGAIDIHDEEGYAAYRAGVAPIFKAFPGIEILSGDPDPVVFEGELPARHMFIIKFESMEQIRQFLTSDAYREAARHRHGSSTTYHILGMKGLDEA
jgi:uncharacterized protein (DUF1330 family)